MNTMNTTDSILASQQQANADNLEDVASKFNDDSSKIESIHQIDKDAS